eukprot:5228447-Amphidinium_carterae.2
MFIPERLSFVLCAVLLSNKDAKAPLTKGDVRRRMVGRYTGRRRRTRKEGGMKPNDYGGGNPKEEVGNPKA